MSAECEKYPPPPGGWPEQKPVTLPDSFYLTLIAVAKANALDKAKAERRRQVQDCKEVVM